MSIEQEKSNLKDVAKNKEADKGNEITTERTRKYLEGGTISEDEARQIIAEERKKEVINLKEELNNLEQEKIDKKTADGVTELSFGEIQQKIQEKIQKTKEKENALEQKEVKAGQEITKEEIKKTILDWEKSEEKKQRDSFKNLIDNKNIGLWEKSLIIEKEKNRIEKRMKAKQSSDKGDLLRYFETLRDIFEENKIAKQTETTRAKNEDTLAVEKARKNVQNVFSQEKGENQKTAETFTKTEAKDQNQTEAGSEILKKENNELKNINAELIEKNKQLSKENNFIKIENDQQRDNADKKQKENDELKKTIETQEEEIKKMAEEKSAMLKRMAELETRLKQMEAEKAEGVKSQVEKKDITDTDEIPKEKQGALFLDNKEVEKIKQKVEEAIEEAKKMPNTKEKQNEIITKNVDLLKKFIKDKEKDFKNIWLERAKMDKKLQIIKEVLNEEIKHIGELLRSELNDKTILLKNVLLKDTNIDEGTFAIKQAIDNQYKNGQTSDQGVVKGLLEELLKKETETVEKIKQIQNEYDKGKNFMKNIYKEEKRQDLIDPSDIKEINKVSAISEEMKSIEQTIQDTEKALKEKFNELGLFPFEVEEKSVEEQKTK